MSLINYEKKEHICYITLDRLENLNAMSRELSKRLIESLFDYDSDPELWVAIVTGAGDRAFCVGADLKDASHMNEPEVWETWYVENLLKIKKPLIAAVNGYCLGAGLTLALACDLRVAAQNATFGTPDQKINTVDCYAALALAYFIPPALAMEILFTGESIDAFEAYRIGLVNRVVPIEDLIATAELLAHKICLNGPLAVKACKELARQGRTMATDNGLTLFRELAHKVLNSEDTAEGVSAFLEKRLPVWKCK